MIRDFEAEINKQIETYSLVLTNDLSLTFCFAYLEEKILSSVSLLAVYNRFTAEDSFYFLCPKTIELIAV